MGVLEDAIREHLDLKRKHGASDAELNQQEAEALGPARRDAPEDEVAEAAPVEADAPAETADATPVEDAPVVGAPVTDAPVEEPAVEEPALPEAEAPEAPLPPTDTPADPDFGDEPPEHKPQRDFDFD